MIDPPKKPDVTAAQIRGGRGIMGWSRPKFAALAGVSVATVLRFEEGGEGSVLGLNAMINTLKAHGIEFVPGGARKRDDPMGDDS